MLSVTDNGVGFETSLKSDGHGLMSLKRRAHRLKGTLEVTSGPGVGTTVTTLNSLREQVGDSRSASVASHLKIGS